MAINFDSLPTANPNGLPAPDVYKAHIAEAEVRIGKTSGNPYLNLKYNITNHAGKGCGSIYDIIVESDNPTVQYKIGRFIAACGIPLHGSMELGDIAKLVKGKDIIIDVNHDTKGQQPRAQVDLFTREAYYPVGMFDQVYQLAHMNDGQFGGDATAEAAPLDVSVPEGSPEEVDY